MSSTVLITGATGFLGSHLVKALLKDNYRIVILKRSFSKTKRIDDVLSQCYVYNIDQCELSKPFEDLGEIDAVIHTATCYGRNNETTAGIVEANVVFPLRLLETSSFYKTNLFFNTDTFFNKNSGSYSYLNTYTTSKKHFLDWGKQFAEKQSIKFVNLKLEHIFGAGDDDSKFVNHIIKSCLNNVEELKLTAGEQKRDFIHIDDTISIYQLVLEKAQQEPSFYQEYPIGSGQAITIREFVEMIHKLTKSKTILQFGALPYRNGEITFSEANLDVLIKLGWLSKNNLDIALLKTIKQEINNLGKDYCSE
jgi:nucleoside-diphosphate-sugar epimerase